ncbi:MAG: SDR family oxidoreductase [Nitrospirae bacterium]|nr:SDR family oxidoreductase [Nitrospirota bacterium]MBF0535633.1 SDR family oxidoreductase [Nitrospirota bacterium]MBF0616939.1 SDR family oxidoreductase [Nitrospirota bacterium]
MEDIVNNIRSCALITGSSRGIGRAIAFRFAKSGVDVAVNYSREGGKSESAAEALVEEFKSLGVNAVSIKADISKKDEVKYLIAETISNLGRLDYLVLNAAKAPFKPIEKLFERELNDLVRTNYMGNIFCVQEALSHLEAASGKIVFISSLGSKYYNASYPLGSMKAAMEAVVRDLSETLSKRGISVNAVSGGIVKTDSFKVLRQYVEGLDMMPESFFVTPEEIADVVYFLCSGQSRGISGQTIIVDRGMSNSLFRNFTK